MTAEQGGLLGKRGMALAHGGYGLSVVALKSSVAIVYSDGRISFGGENPTVVTSDTILSSCSSTDTASIVLGTDKGRVLRVQADGRVDVIANIGLNKWVEHVAQSSVSHALVAAVGKQVCVIQENADLQMFIAHPSAITGIAFDPKGKRLAASHYGGVTLSWVSGSGSGVALPWKGSHTALTWSPDGTHVVTAMQECALHGWRIKDKANMRMAGYPGKTRSMAWTHKSRWLATSGAQAVVCWPFFHKDGPMGKAPLELPGHGPAVTRIAVMTDDDYIAAGYDDGAVTLFRFEDQSELMIAPENGSPVSGAAFSHDGTTLGFVREDGSGGILPIR